MYAFWCSVDNGAERKKHTCLQINWFGQEASKEELCVVKQACGEAAMSQQKDGRDHREDHDAVLKDLIHMHTHACMQIQMQTYTHTVISTNTCMQNL